MICIAAGGRQMVEHVEYDEQGRIKSVTLRSPLDLADSTAGREKVWDCSTAESRDKLVDYIKEGLWKMDTLGDALKYCLWEMPAQRETPDDEENNEVVGQFYNNVVKK